MRPVSSKTWAGHSKNESKSLTNLKYEGLPIIEFYKSGDILSNAVLHADFEYDTYRRRMAIEKKLFSKNCFAKLFY